MLAAVCVVACSTAKHTAIQSTPVTETEKPEIAFLVFHITRDSISGKDSIALIQTTRSAGTFKRQEHQAQSQEYLSFELLKNNKPADHYTLPHPLYPVFEYAEGNELTSKKVQLLQAEFFLRVQLTGNNYTMKIFETLPGIDKRELLNVNL